MKKVFCLNKISPIGLKVLPKSYEVSTESIDSADAVMVRSAAMHEMKLPESVLCVARAGAGVNNIPLQDYAKVGVVVFNTPGANANAVKELTIAGMLLCARDLPGSMDWVKQNSGDAEINKNMEKAKAAFAGTEILGKTLGIIGCGAIGALVSESAAALGMHVLGVEPSKATIERYKDKYPRDMEFVTADELYERSDYISVHVPLLDSTKEMINSKTMAKMKNGVVILNCSRDALVNDDDMREALASGKVRRYVTDFPNFKTANMSGVVAFSHLGASTEEAEDNCAAMAASEIVDFVENGNIVNSVNYPNLSLGKSEGVRVVALHSSSLEGSKIIADVANCCKIIKSATAVKGDFAATIVDLTCKEDKQNCLKNTVALLPGMLRFRVIK
ncbi:MAG TPA: 3-phosphoglycerate dehydrogenase [Bacilli bacterium]|nr:3-phosphoglycerate dehydrogenase [Bacilli bacterium]HPS18510.1 3-phosphoglycerate dehydrogenase [Bacilli bacterium]